MRRRSADKKEKDGGIMKRYLVKVCSLLFLTGVMVCAVYGCATHETERIKKETEYHSKTETELMSAQTENNEIKLFSFEEIVDRDFLFCSGAGAWSTRLFIKADGSFLGEFCDVDGGAGGNGYQSTITQSVFCGQFTQPVQVNAYTYSMQIAEITYENKPDTEVVTDEILYRYTTPYGLDGAKDILIYLPGAPLAELPEDFRGWVGCLGEQAGETLPFYALNNEVMQYGFSSYDIVDQLHEQIDHTKGRSDVLKTAIGEKEVLSPSEYDEQTSELYELWDVTLNEVWGVLKRLLDDETMNALTEEEREWIIWKEAEIRKTEEEHGNDTMQSAIVNLRAAELTEKRVDDLLIILESVKRQS